MKIKAKKPRDNRRQKELETLGVSINEVYGSKRTSFLFVCLSKAVIIFLVCYGTVSGFADAFSLNYNSFLLAAFTMFSAILITLLYLKKKVFYIGYAVLLVVFTVELIRYYLYANSGFQAIMNRVREAYAEYFGMTIVRTSEERYTNRYVTITIALIFITVFLIIMYNITVSRYMNFLETFVISFLILEIPMYIGYKPPLHSVVMVMTGCICTSLLQRGAFNRITVPGKGSTDYISDRFFRKSYYTTRGSHKGVITAILFSFFFSVMLSVFSLPIYDRPLGETKENSAKSSFDDYVRIFVQNGFYGLFNRYDSLNGMNRGLLGGVSSVRPDFQTDLIVNFVPDGTDTVYLKGFTGSEYLGQRWTDQVSGAAFANRQIRYRYGDTLKNSASLTLRGGFVDRMYEMFIEEALKNRDNNAKMEIDYVDLSYGMDVSPYQVLPRSSVSVKEPVVSARSDQKEFSVIESIAKSYIPLEKVELKDSKEVKDIEKGLTVDDGSGNVLNFYDYINTVCTYVPENVSGYLGAFFRDHNYLGLSLSDYKNALIKRDPAKTNELRLKTCEAIEKLFLDEYPYSLSPGKTPDKGDFIIYFLEEQKRGYCSHFASAATMMLRYFGIPARYVEGYCVPASLVRENGAFLEGNGEEWYRGENAYNPSKRICSVEVSDYYAHAWVEVYMEGEGFVPYEFTPPSFENVPEGGGLSGIGEFFSRLMNVDLGFGADEKTESTIIDSGSTAVLAEPDGFDFSVILAPVGIIVAILAFFWFSFMLIKLILREIKCSKLYKKGEFAPLIYLRYVRLVRRLKRKGVISLKNPLPMELTGPMSEYLAAKRSKDKTVSAKETERIREKEYGELERVFTYVERVLYSGYRSNAEEYDSFYRKIKNT